MGVDANGRAVKPTKDANAAMDGASERRSRRRNRRAQRSFFGRLLSLVTKIAIWYAIITSAFFCPQSLDKLDDTSPAICKPYLRTKTFVQPYIQPQYEHYLEPYWKTAEPYVNRFQTQVYAPAAAFSRKYYNAYAAPSIDKLYKYLDDEWEKQGVPRLKHAQNQAWDMYDESLGPHVKTVSDTIGPYYDRASKTARDTYNQQLLPAYSAARPYALRAWQQGHYATVNIIFPYLRWAAYETQVFLSRQLWPTIRVLYGENVEPQLVRIRERLGRYRDGKKMEAAMNGAEASPVTAGTLSPEAASSIASSISESPYPSSSVESASSGPTEAEIREQIESDLKVWHERFAKAADKGAEDLEERVAEIIDRQIRHQAQGVGRAHVIKLEETVNSRLNTVKEDINEAVKHLPGDASEKDIEVVYDGLVTKIRKAGSSIRDKAQEIRTWKQKFDNETHSLVKAASESTLAVIDNIRELGLQEIGMRFANMEGVTYQDWSKYHTLKRSFDEWRNEVETVADRHGALADAMKEGEAVEDKGMSIAGDAAKELGRLKDVAKYKLNAGDSSDDFSSKAMPPKAAKAAQQVVEKAKDPSKPSSESAPPNLQMQSLSSLLAAQRAKASQKAEEFAEDQSSLAAGSSTGSVQSIASEASKKFGQPEPAKDRVSSALKSNVDQASSSVTAASSDAASAASSAGMSASKEAPDLEEAKSSVSSFVVGSEPGPAQKVSSKASEAVAGSKDTTESLSSKASSVVKSAESVGDSILSAPKFKKDQEPMNIKGTPGPAEQASSYLSSEASEASEAVAREASTASSSAKRVPGGVSAGFVAATEAPILDEKLEDDDNKKPNLVDLLGNLGNLGNNLGGLGLLGNMGLLGTLARGDLGKLLSGDLGKKVQKEFSTLSEIMSKAIQPTPTQGSVESVTSVASEKMSSAVGEVLSILYFPGAGVPRGAEAKYSAAITAASNVIWGTPPPLTASLASEASSRYAEATNLASEQYEIARKRLSEQIAGSPKPGYEEVLSSVESAYSGSVEQAKKKLNEAVSTVSASISAASAYVAPTQNVYESISSMASERLAAGVADANQQFTSAKIAVGMQPPPIHQQYLASASAQYLQALGLAQERYSSFMTAASTAVYGTPTPAYESLMAAARSSYAEASLAAGAFIDDLYSTAKSIGGSAPEATPSSLIDAAIKRYDEAMKVASEQLAAASSEASVQFYGAATGTAAVSHGAESIARQVSENWESLVSKASEQVYGAPTPWHEAAWSSAAVYGAQATAAAAEQYNAIQSLVQELVSGKEPDFTESVMSRLSAAYSTGFGVPEAASSVSSAASEAYSSVESVAGEVYGSASSIITNTFTAAPAVENIFNGISDQFEHAVSAASVQIYGKEKNSWEKATSDLDMYASNAQDLLSSAIYGTKTQPIGAVTTALDERYSWLLSAASESLAAAGSQANVAYNDMVASVSSAVYGPEQGAFESATSRLNAAVESAKARMKEYGDAASNAVTESYEAVADAAADAASSVSSVASEAMGKDEL